MLVALVVLVLSPDCRGGRLELGWVEWSWAGFSVGYEGGRVEGREGDSARACMHRCKWYQEIDRQRRYGVEKIHGSAHVLCSSADPKKRQRRPTEKATMCSRSNEGITTCSRPKEETRMWRQRESWRASCLLDDM